MEPQPLNCAKISQADINWLSRLYHRKITGVLSIEFERRSNIIARANLWYKPISTGKQ